MMFSTRQSVLEENTMPVSAVYNQIEHLLSTHVSAEVDESSKERLALLVTGIIGAKSASPARIAKALRTLGLCQADEASIERRVRRIENDPEINASTCFHPLARGRLLFGRPQELLLILDPTTQDDRVVMLSAAVWYRGRALPLAWAVWPANTPLSEERFWQRVAALLDTVAELLPPGVAVTWVADCAFGTPAFTDLLVKYGWHYVVRVQEQTVCRDGKGRERQVRALVRFRNQRAKLRGQVFKGRGWRPGSVVVYWGKGHKRRLCLVSDLPPRFHLIALYRRRYPIEASFRDYKTAGWRWEQGQVRELEHLDRLLVGMALATWITLLAGTQVGEELLAKKATGRRRTKPWAAKQSLFSLGLQRLQEMLHHVGLPPLHWQLSDWQAPNWQTQITSHHTQAYVFAA